ncbi:MAG TPA: alpha-amylase family glycosyl hydrolase [Anaerolineales bacterium]
MSPSPWFHHTTIYQIYPRSYYDSNADGIGDIPGIIQKLDYLRDLGVETIWCSPFFKSPQRDFGYDVSDYEDIAPEYGTLDDCLRLIEQVHQRGLRIIFDLVMNHTSDQHPWFLESRSSRDNPRADWYLWRDKPNNWQSYTRFRGWHYAPERRQYYWASYLPFQPDLNYRNPAVKQAMFEMVRFWLRKGVDGFRLDMFNSIFKDAQFRNNPLASQFLPNDTPPSRFFQEARYSTNQPESFAFAQELRAVCDEFGEKMLLGEVSGPRAMIRRFMGDEANNGLALVFDFHMLGLKFTAGFFRDIISQLEQHFEDPFMPVYVFSNHDAPRSIWRLGNDRTKARLLLLLQLTVRGVPCMYYGEEVGMTDANFARSTALDPIAHEFRLIPDFLFDRLGITINRDVVRTPMQWDATRNAGFSSASQTWLPVNSDYPTVNVAVESTLPDSLLNTGRELLNLRTSENALHAGSLELLDNLPDGVLGYLRRWGGNELAIYLNFSPAPARIASRGGRWTPLYRLSPADDFYDGETVLSPFSGMILKRDAIDVQRTLEKARRRTS